MLLLSAAMEEQEKEETKDTIEGEVKSDSPAETVVKLSTTEVIVVEDEDDVTEVATSSVKESNVDTEDIIQNEMGNENAEESIVCDVVEDEETVVSDNNIEQVVENLSSCDKPATDNQSKSIDEVSIDAIESVVNVESEGLAEEVLPTSESTLDNTHTSYATVLHELANLQTTSSSAEEEVNIVVNKEIDQLSHGHEERFTCDECEQNEELTLESMKSTLQHNLAKIPFTDLKNVAKSLGISTSLNRKTMTSVIVEQQLALQAQVVVENDINGMTPAKENDEGAMEDYDEISSKDIDLIFEAADENYDEYEENSNEEEEFHYQKKLFTSPAVKNTKTIFISPSTTKGKMPYEKYKVTWTYDAFENKNPQLLEAPQGSWDENGGENSPSSRIGSKLQGIPTPTGKKTIFKSPLKSTEKPYYNYNVHWSYDEYRDFTSKL